MIRMINKIKKDMYKNLNELNEGTNKQLIEIRKTMQGMKEGLNKETEILKKIKLKF
jgi:hypothetical protein